MAINTIMEIQKTIYAAIAVSTKIPMESLHEEISFKELDIASIDTVMVLFEVEKSLCIEIPPGKFDESCTIGEFSVYLLSLINNR